MCQRRNQTTRWLFPRFRAHFNYRNTTVKSAPIRKRKWNFAVPFCFSTRWKPTMHAECTSQCDATRKVLCCFSPPLWHQHVQFFAFMASIRPAPNPRPKPRARCFHDSPIWKREWNPARDSNHQLPEGWSSGVRQKWSPRRSQNEPRSEWFSFPFVY